MTRWLWTGLLCLLCAGTALATLHATPAALDFGSVAFGHEQMGWVMVTQDGPAAIEVSGTVTGAGFYATRSIQFVLQPGDSGIAVAVSFIPDTATSNQNYTGSLTLTASDPALPDVVVPLSGTGIYVPPEPYLELSAPENGAWIDGVPITFIWNPVVAPIDPLVTYTLWILGGDSNRVPTPYPAGEALSYTLDDPSYTEGYYMWWVVAEWPGTTVESPHWSFLIGEPPPPPPTFELLSPANEGTVTLPNGTFVWSTLDVPNVPAEAIVYELFVVPADSIHGEFRPVSMSTTDTTATMDLTSLAGQERCYWYVLAHLSNGAVFSSNGFRFFELGAAQQPQGVGEVKAPLATRFAIASAAPNPFNPETRITLAVPQAGRVVAEVFDVLGRKVATLVDGPLAAGDHTMTWRPNGPAGLYILRVQHAQGASDVRKLLFIK